MGDAGAIFGIGILVLGWVGVSIVMPIVALSAARRARREVDQLRDELTALRRLAAGISQPPPIVAPPPPVIVTPPLAVAVEKPEPPPIVEPPPVTPPPPAVEPPPPLETPPAPIDEPTPPPPAPPPTSAPAASLEEQIALVWFTRIGAAALLLGVAWFFKYAVDNNWIGPLGRVALGALAGAGVLVATELLRPRTRTVYIQVLAGVGLALLYVSAYAAFAFYHLFPASAAFAAVAVVTLLGGALAVHHRGEAILMLALIAGLLSPVLLSTGEDRPAALFGYLFVLTAFVFWAALRMSFRWATWLAVVGPPILFAGWYGKFFDAAPPPAQPSVDVAPETLAGAYYHLAHRAAPLVAVAAFFAEWVAVGSRSTRWRAAASSPRCGRSPSCAPPRWHRTPGSPRCSTIVRWRSARSWPRSPAPRRCCSAARTDAASCSCRSARRFWCSSPPCTAPRAPTCSASWRCSRCGAPSTPAPSCRTNSPAGACPRPA